MGNRQAIPDELDRIPVLALGGGGLAGLGGGSALTASFGGDDSTERNDNRTQAGDGQRDDGTSPDSGQLSVVLGGEGPSHPVEFTVQANDVEVGRTIEPDDDDIERDDAGERLQVKYKYDKGKLELDAEHRMAGTTLKFKVKQESWTRTTGDLGFPIEDGTVTFDAETNVRLPNSQKDAVVTDELPDDELKFEVKGYVKDDGTDTDIDYKVDD